MSDVRRGLQQQVPHWKIPKSRRHTTTCGQSTNEHISQVTVIFEIFSFNHEMAKNTNLDRSQNIFNTSDLLLPVPVLLFVVIEKKWSLKKINFFILFGIFGSITASEREVGTKEQKKF